MRIRSGGAEEKERKNSEEDEDGDDKRISFLFCRLCIPSLGSGRVKLYSSLYSPARERGHGKPYSLDKGWMGCRACLVVM
jgi:hypothetical protein